MQTGQSAPTDLREYSFQMVVDEILKPNGVKMGGFPQEIFVALTDEEQDTWTCNICFLIANDARMCQNSHLFCNTCIFAWTLTYGENSKKCPFCRCDQDRYLENKEVEKALRDRTVICPEESCGFKAPLKVFLMHSHGRSKYDNSNVDLESLRPQRRTPMQLVFLPNIRSSTEDGQPTTIRAQLQQGRDMIHQMMLLLHLEMQLRQQAMLRFSTANNPSDRVQIIDEVLALNEQLSEVGTVLSTLLSSQSIPAPPPRMGMVGLLSMVGAGQNVRADSPVPDTHSDDSDTSDLSSIQDYPLRRNLGRNDTTEALDREDRIRRYRERLAALRHDDSDDDDDDTPVPTYRRALPDNAQPGMTTDIHPRVLVGRPQVSALGNSSGLDRHNHQAQVEVETISRLSGNASTSTSTVSSTTADTLAGSSTPVLPPIGGFPTPRDEITTPARSSAFTSAVSRTSVATALASRTPGITVSSLGATASVDTSAVSSALASTPIGQTTLPSRINLTGERNASSSILTPATPTVTATTISRPSLFDAASSGTATTSSIIRSFAQAIEEDSPSPTNLPVPVPPARPSSRNRVNTPGNRPSSRLSSSTTATTLGGSNIIPTGSRLGQSVTSEMSRDRVRAANQRSLGGNGETDISSRPRSGIQLRTFSASNRQPMFAEGNAEAESNTTQPMEENTVTEQSQSSTQQGGDESENMPTEGTRARAARAQGQSRARNLPPLRQNGTNRANGTRAAQKRSNGAQAANATPARVRKEPTAGNRNEAPNGQSTRTRNQPMGDATGHESRMRREPNNTTFRAAVAASRTSNVTQHPLNRRQSIGSEDASAPRRRPSAGPGASRVLNNGPTTHGQLMRARRRSEIRRELGEGRNE